MKPNIEAERARHGFTKGCLADTLGISRTTYEAYIGEGAIPSDKLVAMSNLFGVSIDYLLGHKVKAPTD